MSDKTIDKETAIEILQTVIENTKNDTIKEALSAVSNFIKKAFIPDFTMTPEERRAEIDRLLKEVGYMRDRDNMTPAERREAVRYYGEGLRCKTAG